MSLAEDNALNAEIAITILNEMGIKVDHVEDGIQCVSKMEQMPADTYDLKIPIIAMPANAFEEDKKEALAKGMTGHIAKPIDVKNIEEVLLSVL